MSLRVLELTPKLEKLLVDSGLTTVDLVIEHENRLSSLPGMTAKRFADLSHSISMHKAHLRDLERRRFIADRNSQVWRIDLVMRFLDQFQSGGTLPCSIEDAQAACREAQRYASIMAQERHAANVAAWIQHKEDQG